MDIYHTYDTGPSKAFLFKRKTEDFEGNETYEYVDPEDATAIVCIIKINGEEYYKLNIVESENLFIVEDEEGYNRVKLVFGPDYLNETGVYQIKFKLTFADGTETSPKPWEFRVIDRWEAEP